MGRSRLVLAAAVALVLGCVLPMVGAFGAPTHAQLAPPSVAADRIRFEPVEGAAGLTVAGVGTYRGAIEIARAAGGLAVINEVSFEDYVKGISEVPSAWPIEALKAQAIAARTYALWEYRRQLDVSYKAVGAHICATQACQVYTGLTKERSQNGNRWAAAVEATKSQVLWWRDGPIVAKYSSSNGGESVPGGQPYLRAVHDPDDAHSPLHTWRVTISARDLAAAVGLAPRAVTAIQRVGDAVLLTAMHQPGDSVEEPAHLTLDALELRERINANIAAPAPLPRTLPTVRFNATMTPDNDAVVFDGRGWGHGIGLSQWGAYGKASRGMKAPDILAAYYAGLKPVTVPAPHVPDVIKVAVSLDSGATTVAPADGVGRVRVVNAATGEVISHGDAAPWSVTPAKGAVAATAGTRDAAPAQVTLADGQRTTFGPREAIEVRVRLDAPAVFTAQAAPPTDAAPSSTPAAAPSSTPGDAPPPTPTARPSPTVPIGEPELFPAGEIVLTLPPATAPGPYTVTIDTDRGGGRTASTTLTLEIADPAAAGTGAGDPTSEPPGGHTATAAGASSPLQPGLTVIAALGSLVGVAVGTARTVALGRRRPSPLH